MTRTITTEKEMATIEIKNKRTQEIIFSHTKDENNVDLYRADLHGANLHEANLHEANLYRADLYRANLHEANLHEANLHGADLSEANLSEANLSEANLHEANLHEANLHEANLYRADLSEANLHEANLHGADLHGTIGNMREVCSMQIEDFPITFTKNVLQIGCKNHTHEQWRAFTDAEIDSMHSQALPFWKKWKDHIFKTIELKYGERK